MPDAILWIYPNDSIYIPISGLGHFIEAILPHLETDIVLILGQRAYVPMILRAQYDNIIEHPRIVRIFIQNLSVYAYDPQHPKIHPFPYGMLTGHPKQYLTK